MWIYILAVTQCYGTETIFTKLNWRSVSVLPMPWYQSKTQLVIHSSQIKTVIQNVRFFCFIDVITKS